MWTTAVASLKYTIGTRTVPDSYSCLRRCSLRQGPFTKPEAVNVQEWIVNHFRMVIQTKQLMHFACSAQDLSQTTLKTEVSSTPTLQAKASSTWWRQRPLHAKRRLGQSMHATTITTTIIPMPKMTMPNVSHLVSASKCSVNCTKTDMQLFVSETHWSN